MRAMRAMQVNESEERGGPIRWVAQTVFLGLWRIGGQIGGTYHELGTDFADLGRP